MTDEPQEAQVETLADEQVYAVLDTLLGPVIPTDDLANRLAWHQRHPGKKFGDRKIASGSREPSEYEDEAYCDHCDDDTPHKFYDSGHERDSSNDRRTCLKCGWIHSGLTGEYTPPTD